MFSKVLVANRGEISVRITRALREMGVGSVAVYSDTDRESLHTRLADEAYHVGPAPATESYLNVGRLLDVAEKSGAEAVHPGYGFLAEGPDFARAVADAGLVWIGPHPGAIEAMGSKIESRRLMQKTGVPVIPGTEAYVGSVEEMLGFGSEHGYPLAVKATAGGGGKGFAVAGDKTEAEAAFDRARREGEAYFSDATVYLERYLPSPRHVEIQVACDRHGDAIHFGERECSVQRLHQKLLEECPSPALDAAMRERMGETALDAARAVGYDSLGTVEFLVQGEEFYFLEMNTRIQVEHPVTEEVTGIDLVKLGVRMAAGEPLPLSQDEMFMRGHAIEVRVNAEDPAAGFSPAPGYVSGYREPSGPGVRLDSSLDSPGEVPEHYDPLFAKLIARGSDRGEVIARLRRAIEEFRVDGVPTTLPFFRALLDDEHFLSGEYDTGFVEARLGELNLVVSPQSSHEPEAKEAREVEVEVNGRLFRVRLFDGVEGRKSPPRRDGRRASGGSSEGAVEAPMQGTIVRVLVGEGEEVEAGQAVCVLEAMKMESEIRTSKAGVITKVLVEEGKTVRSGEAVVVLE
jgi:acetyl-CoA/propionyl-CoA carboxylase biotin carboxyl carrier protein